MAQCDTAHLISGHVPEGTDSTCPSSSCAPHLTAGEAQVSFLSSVEGVGQELQHSGAQKDTLQDNTYVNLSSSPRPLATNSGSTDLANITSSLAAESRDVATSSAINNENVSGILQTEEATKHINQLYSIPSSSPQPAALKSDAPIEHYSIVSSSPQPVAPKSNPPIETYSILSSSPQPVAPKSDSPIEHYSIVSSSPQPVAPKSNPPIETYSILTSSPQPVAPKSDAPIEHYSIVSSSPQPVSPKSNPPIETYSIVSSSPQPVAPKSDAPIETYSIVSSSPQPVAPKSDAPIEIYSIVSSSPQPVAPKSNPPIETYSIVPSSPQPVAMTSGPSSEHNSTVTSSPQPVAMTSEKCMSVQDSESVTNAAVTELLEISENTTKKRDSLPFENNSLSVKEALPSDILPRQASAKNEEHENGDFKGESTPKRASVKSLMDEKELIAAQSEKKQQNLERKVSRSASFSKALKRMTGKKEEEKIADGDGNTLDMTDKAHGTLYLKKKRLFSMWRKYFFVLDGSQLTYYSNREQYGRLTGCQGSVDLTLLNDVSKKKASFCFRTFYPLLLERRSRSALYLGAETVEEQQRWLELLQRALETRKAASRRVSHAKVPASSTSPDVVSSTLPNAKTKKKRSGSLTKKLSFRRKSADKSNENYHSSSEEELNLIREEKTSLKDEPTARNEETDETKEAYIVQPKKILKVGIPGIVSEIGSVRLKKTSQGIEKGTEVSADLRTPEAGSEGMFGVQLKKTNLKEKLMEDKSVENSENAEGDSVEERGHDFRSLLRSRRISTTGVDTKLYVKYGGDPKSDDKDKKRRSPSPNLPLSRNVQSVLDNGTESSDLVTKDYLDQGESSENKKDEVQEGSSVTDSPVVVMDHLDVIDLTNGKQCAVQHAVAQNIRYSDPPNELKPLESKLNSASKSPSPNPEEVSSKCDEEGWEMVTSFPDESDAVVPIEEGRPASSPEEASVDEPRKISQISNIFISSTKRKMENTSTEIDLAEEKEDAKPQSQSSNSVDDGEPNGEILPVNFPSILLEEDQGDTSNTNNIILDNESSISLSPVHTMRIIEAKRKTHSLDSLDDIVSHTYELLPEDPRASNSIETSEMKDESYDTEYVNIESIMTTLHSQDLVTTLKEISESSEDEVVDSTIDEVMEPDTEDILETYVDEAEETNSDDDSEPIDDEVQVLPDNKEEANWMQAPVDDDCLEDDADDFLRRDKPSRQALIPDDRKSEPVTFHLDTSQSSGTNSISGDDSLPRPDYNPQFSLARSSSVESGEPLQRTSFMGTRLSWGASSNVDHSKGSNSDITVSRESVSATNSMLSTVDYTATDLQVPGMIRKVGSGSTDTLTTLKDSAPMRKLNQRKRPVSQPVSSNRDSLILPEFVVVEEDVHDCTEQKNKEEI